MWFLTMFSFNGMCQILSSAIQIRRRYSSMQIVDGICEVEYSATRRLRLTANRWNYLLTLSIWFSLAFILISGTCCLVRTSRRRQVVVASPA